MVDVMLTDCVVSVVKSLKIIFPPLHSLMRRVLAEVKAKIDLLLVFYLKLAVDKPFIPFRSL